MPACGLSPNQLIAVLRLFAELPVTPLNGLFIRDGG